MHVPVLLQEVMEYLNLAAGSRIVDATLNGGGYVQGMLNKYPDIKILGIELDPGIYQVFQEKDISKKIVSVNDSYVNLKKIIKDHHFSPDGIVFDLGVSLWHFEQSGKGFSFKKNEPLDMRFNEQLQKISAVEIVNTYSRRDLEILFQLYGEEQFASRIAKNIVAARTIKPLLTTSDLVDVIEASVPRWYKNRKIHSATKTFQALRIAVNGELDNLKIGVEDAIRVLKKKGRLIVISYHGLEDKIVREIFKQKAKEGIVRWVKKGTIKPTWEEVKSNPRARSAKMKVIEKI